jgi:hypothetical protein
VWPQELRFLSPNDLRDHSVHQRVRCKSAESRINLLLGTLPRYCSVDETRDWSQQSNTKMIFFRIGEDNIGKVFSSRKRVTVIHLREHFKHCQQLRRRAKSFAVSLD